MAAGGGCSGSPECNRDDWSISTVPDVTSHTFMMNATDWNRTGSDGHHFTPGGSMMRFFLTVSVLGAIILAAIVGNIFVIAAIALERNLRTVANYLIASLAVADLLVAALVMPLAAVNEVSARWFLGRELCDAFVTFDVICCTASILHLVAISFDRYWAVTRVDYIHNRSSKRIVGMIVASWAVSLVISIPPLFIQTHPSYDPNESGVCLISQDLGYTVFSTVGAFYLPCVVMMVIYGKVFRAARARIHKKRFRSQPPNPYPDHRHHPQQQQQAEPEVDTSIDAGQFVSSASEGAAVLSAASPDEGAGDSILSQSPPTERQLVLGTTVTLTVFDYDEDDDNADEDRISPASAADVDPAPPAAAARPNQLALHDADRNGTLSPTGSLSSPRRQPSTASRLLSTPLRNSSVSLRGSWLDLTKQFIMDRRKDLSPKSKEQRAKERLEQKRERKAARTLAVITGSFIICWLPFFIIALVRPFCGDRCHYPDLLLSVIGWLGYFNSLLNPIIYTVFNPDFRSAFRKILFGKYRSQTGSRRRRPRRVLCDPPSCTAVPAITTDFTI